MGIDDIVLYLLLAGTVGGGAYVLYKQNSNSSVTKTSGGNTSLNPQYISPPNQMLDPIISTTPDITKDIQVANPLNYFKTQTKDVVKNVVQKKVSDINIVDKSIKQKQNEINQVKVTNYDKTKSQVQQINKQKQVSDINIIDKSIKQKQKEINQVKITNYDKTKSQVQQINKHYRKTKMTPITKTLSIATALNGMIDKNGVITTKEQNNLDLGYSNGKVATRGIYNAEGQIISYVTENLNSGHTEGNLLASPNNNNIAANLNEASITAPPGTIIGYDTYNKSPVHSLGSSFVNAGEYISKRGAEEFISNQAQYDQQVKRGYLTTISSTTKSGGVKEITQPYAGTGLGPTESITSITENGKVIPKGGLLVFKPKPIKQTPKKIKSIVNSVLNNQAAGNSGSTIGVITDIPSSTNNYSPYVKPSQQHKKYVTSTSTTSSTTVPSTSTTSIPYTIVSTTSSTTVPSTSTTSIPYKSRSITPTGTGGGNYSSYTPTGTSSGKSMNKSVIDNIGSIISGVNNTVANTVSTDWHNFVDNSSAQARNQPNTSPSQNATAVTKTNTPTRTANSGWFSQVASWFSRI